MYLLAAMIFCVIGTAMCQNKDCLKVGDCSADSCDSKTQGPCCALWNYPWEEKGGCGCKTAMGGYPICCNKEKGCTFAMN